MATRVINFCSKTTQSRKFLNITGILPTAQAPEASSIRGVHVACTPLTGYKTSPLIFASCRDCLSYLASAETVRDHLLPAETCAPSTKNGFLQRLSVWFCFLPRLSAGSRITQTVSAGSYLPSTTDSAGNKRLPTVSVEAKYDRQSWRKPNMTDSLCWKRKLADSFIPCALILAASRACAAKMISSIIFYKACVVVSLVVPHWGTSYEEGTIP